MRSIGSPVRLATVFSGIGAIEHALQRLNIEHKIVLASDIDKFVKQSYFTNYDIDETRWVDDISDINGKLLKDKVDLLVGGSPCQSFSMVGKRKGLEDERGLLIYEFARLVREMTPNVFIYENVKGLLTHNKGQTWSEVKSEFKKTGYDIHYSVLNAKDFGIPQHRERLFVVGFREPRNDFSFPNPIPSQIVMHDLLEDTPDPKYTLPEKGVNFVTKPKNLKKKYTQINGDIALCQKANQQFNWHGDFVLCSKNEVDQKYFLSDKVANYVVKSGTKGFYSKPELDLDVARPLLSSMHKMHRAGVDNYVTRDKRIRKLTPRECLRLMGFDDRFKIAVSDTQMYRQAGNSIVVDVLIHLLGAIGFETRNGEVSTREQRNSNRAAPVPITKQTKLNSRR